MKNRCKWLLALLSVLRATWVKSGLESLLSINLLLCRCGRTTQHRGGKEKLYESSMEGLDKATESNMKIEDSVVFRTLMWNVICLDLGTFAQIIFLCIGLFYYIKLIKHRRGFWTWAFHLPGDSFCWLCSDLLLFLFFWFLLFKDFWVCQCRIIIFNFPIWRN